MDLLESEEMNYSADSETITNQGGLLTCFVCEGESCLDNRTSSEFCTNATECWVSSVRDADGSEKFKRGCIQDTGAIPLCNTIGDSTHSDKLQGVYRINCCSENFCNNGSFPVLPSIPIRKEATSPDQQSIFIVLGLLLSIMIILGIIAYMWWKCRKNSQVDASSSCVPVAFRNNRSKIYLDPSGSSGSGSGHGQTFLSQRTLAQQISLVEVIGKGRYGEVWRGTWQGRNVAVKIFLSKDETSWSRETEIYKIVLIRHSNILSFISSDIKSQNFAIQLWLVTEYHKLGSLYDYLNDNCLNYVEMFKICNSIATGIVHLHTEFFGDPGKPAIAHRDIKSKNILVTEHGECVLADFGLAVTYQQNLEKICVMPNTRVGTKRYMAPEVLDETLNAESFESFKRADIYALGLVLWEICRRTSSSGTVEKYEPPFYQFVTTDPSFDEMRKIVCFERRRPEIPNRWLLDEVLRPICILMTECWHENTSVRPTSLRIKKRILKLNINR